MGNGKLCKPTLADYEKRTVLKMKPGTTMRSENMF